MKSRLKCVRCGRLLTPWLEPVSKDFEPEWVDHQNIIPRGHFWLAEDIVPPERNGCLFVHLEDVEGLDDHPDPKRHSGCCGRDGCDGPNKICTCGAEVATEASDCWTSYYAFFERGAVELDSSAESSPTP